MLLGLVAPQEPFGGHYVVDNFVRLLIVFTGYTLALICVKIGLGHWRRREIDRMWGTFAFAFLVVTPAVNGTLNFGDPLSWLVTSFYLLALVCSAIGLGYRVRLSPPWHRFRHRRDRRGPR